MSKRESILIKGARENNLKNVDVAIPKNKIIAITGISGSGKSSLAFDTLFALGRSMYMEALSNSIAKFERPRVEHVSGLMPPIALSQKMSANNNPRSTVGTSMQINSYLRLLFSIAGVFFCPACNIKIAENGQCDQCGYSYPKIQANMFSFNHIKGMCPKCSGLGTAYIVSKDLVIPDENITMEELKLKYERDNVLSYVGRMIDSAVHYLKIDKNTRFCDLNGEGKKFILFGNKEKIRVIIPASKSGMPERETELIFPGFMSYVEKVYMDTSSEDRRKSAEEKYMKVMECTECQGRKLNKISLSVRVMGFNFSEILNLPIKSAIQHFMELQNSKLILDNNNPHLPDVVSTILSRLHNISDVGLDYLTLDRQVATLSGGEAQRLRLSNHLSSELTDVLYIFDEPSAGLHYKDIGLITSALRKLRDNGNTIVIVEHNKQIIQEVDHIIDIGPGAGSHGGNLVASGSVTEVMNNSESVTGRYLSKRFNIDDFSLPKAYNKFLEVRNAEIHNLKNIDVDIPLEAFVCITGISGSGKSSLIFDILYNKLSNIFFDKNGMSNRDGLIRGREYIKEIYYINQSPIGRNQRSTIATYTGFFDKARKVFSETDDAKIYGIGNSDFGLNGGNGRCDKCSGLGFIEQDMYFLPSVQVVCDACNGARYKDEILEIKYRGYNISQVLDMTAEEALQLFYDNEGMKRILETLKEIGLDYVKLGQSVSSLSGGECQRLKLVNELYKKNSSSTLYIFDEPSTGLHPYDIEKLVSIFKKLVKYKNSVIVIEHNVNIILQCDYIIDLGPGGGNEGGNIVAFGHPSQVIKEFNSYTADSLRKIVYS